MKLKKKKIKVPKYNDGGTTNQDSEAMYNAGQQGISQAGMIGSVIGTGMALGNAIGRPIRNEAEQLDENGQLVSQGRAERSFAVGAAFDPFQAGTYQLNNPHATTGDKLMAFAGFGGALKGSRKRYAKSLESDIQPITSGPMGEQFYKQQAQFSYEQGGQTPGTQIEVEGNELEVQNGKLLKDFKKHPSHVKGGFQYLAKPDRVIIPAKDRGRYLEGDKRTRETIEMNKINEHVQRENNLYNKLQRKYKKGGIVPKYSAGGGTNIGNGSYASSIDDAPDNSIVPITDTDGNNFNMGNWAMAANVAGKVIPSLYNFAQGAKKRKYTNEKLNQAEFQNPYEERVKSLMKNRTIDMKPISDEIRNTYDVGLANIGKGTKSSGDVLSGKSALYASRMRALANARLQAQQAENAYRGEEAGTLGNLGSSYAQRKFMIRDANDRNLAAAQMGQDAFNQQRTNFNTAGVEGISTGMQGAYGDYLHAGILKDIYRDYSWNPGTGKWELRKQSV